MLHYLRLWRRFVVMAFVREAEYRVNFFVGVVEGALQFGLAVLVFVILYRFTDEIAGWSRAEVLMLAGVYRVVEGLINMQVAPNLQAIWGYLRTGELDFILLRPVSSQFLVSLRRLSLPEAVNVLSGIGLTVYTGNLAGVRWSLLGVGEAVAFLLCGLLLIYAVWFFVVTCLFWTQVGNLDHIVYGLLETARYPVSFFKGLLRTLLTFAFPVAFATTFPTQALLGRADTRLLITGGAMAACALIGTNLFWNYALRHYSSASS